MGDRDGISCGLAGEAGVTSPLTLVPTGPVVDELDQDRHDLNVVTEWTGPIGNIAAATIFSIVASPWMSSDRLFVWDCLIGLAVVFMIVGTRSGRVAERTGMVGHGLVGALWGSALLLGFDVAVDGVDERFLWAVLAFQFAVSAGVSMGATLDDRKYGPAVLLVMWPMGAAFLLVAGETIAALGALVFLAILLRDVRATSLLIDELFDRRRAEEQRARQARWLAVHDPLTGVANRAGVAEALDGPRDFGAAFFIDLDHFKEVNDRLGHHGGDLVLIEVARRIASLVRDIGFLARLGGDEFVALVERTDEDDDDDGLIRRASAIIAALEQPLTDIATEQVYLSASIGITRLGSDDVLDRVLRRSDDAMYEAKRLGRRRAVIFGHEQLQAGKRRAELSMDVRRAIRQGEIEAWGQPIFCFETRRIVAVELLARWRRAGEDVPPGVFIPIAERIGMTADLTKMMLDRAAAALADWSQHALLAHASIAINVSRTDLRTPTLVGDIGRLLEAGHFAPDRLVLEITESGQRADIVAMSAMLAPLRQLGVRVALDDFGSGHSSFNGVRDLELDAVKLHQSIIHRLDGEPQETRVVGAIARLAEALGRDIIAEGVETDVQVEQLLLLRFRLLQGYAICEPMPVADLGGPRGDVALERLVARYVPV